MKEFSNILKRCCLLLCACIAAGGILITAANYVPINQTNSQNSIAQISGEGYFPEVPSTAGGYGSAQSMNPTALELATDGLMLKMALYDGEDSGFIQAFRCFSTQAEYNREYSRYWHGYVTILRPLLYFFDYYEIRLLNGFAQMFIFCMISFYIWKLKGFKYVAAFTTSYALLMPLALAQCLQYSWAFYVAFVPLLIYLRWKSFWEKENRYVYFFLLVGVVTIYLDLLTYPLFSWGFVMVWWLLLQDKEETWWKYVCKVVYSGIAWIAGYGGMWVGKWALASVILQQNVFQNAISEALLWTVNEGSAAITIKDRFATIFLNWKTYNYKLYAIVIILWVLYAAFRGLGGYRKNQKVPALLLIGVSSFVWYFVLSGHADMHHLFTHRIFGISIAAALAMILLGTEGKAGFGGIRNTLKYAAAELVAGVLAIVFFFMLRDVYAVDNFTQPYVKVQVQESISIPITPDFSNITALRLLISVENDIAGEYVIHLLDGEEVLEEYVIPISEWSEGNLRTLMTDWELQTGHLYTLKITPQGNNGQIYAWMTETGNLPIAEIGENVIDGSVCSQQILSSITYWCRPVGRLQAVFWIVSLYSGLMMIFYAVICGLDNKRLLHESNF